MHVMTTDCNVATLRQIRSMHAVFISKALVFS